MNTWTKRFVALALIAGSSLLLESRASAQLGNLVVTISSPAAGATVSGTTAVSAQVTIVGALTVSQVQFKLDGVNLGAPDSSAPYSIAWDTKTAANGAHTLTAVARDLLGVSWTSQPVGVTVFNDLTPPAVAISSPISGATVRGTISIAAGASDNVGVTGVQFKLDGANLGAEDLAAPYSLSWNTASATNGSHVLTALARDAAGNTTTSASVTVTIDNSAPSVGIASPGAGALLSGVTTVTANASDNIAVAGVQFFVDGAALGTEDTAAPFAAGWNTATATNASHTLTAVARDAAGNVATAAAVTVTVDNSAPVVAITSPDGSTVVSGAITVTADAGDNTAVAGVQFLLNGAPLGAEDLTAPFSAAWDTVPSGSGSHRLSAVARDTAGNTATAESVWVSVVNDKLPPSVAVTSPENGATVSGTVAITASAADDMSIVRVQFMIDGAAFGPEDATAPYSVDWNTASVANGGHVLTAVARDGAGNATTSAAVSVTVSNDTTAPAVSITSPASGATVSGTVTVTANATDDAGVVGVQFRLDGALLGSEDTTAPYSVPLDTTTVSNATHVLTAVARDAAGHVTTSAAVSVTVFNDVTPPAVAITAPANGANVSATITVVAGATDDVAVSGVQFFLDGAVLGAEDTTAPYEVAWDTTSASAGSHTLTASARDAAGHTTMSAGVTVTIGNTSATTRVEDNSGAITFTPAGGWMEGYTDARGWSGGTAALGFVAGQRATLTFTGTGVTWIGFRGPQTGIARVILDGALVATVDAYSATELVQAPMFTATGLAQGPHTLVIEVTRTKNDAANDFYVIVDAFDVTSQGSGTADTTAPTASVTSPAAGAAVSGTITVTASASDNVGVAGVRFFVDGTAFGTEDTTAPYEAAWNTSTAGEGSHTLTAQARDAAGNIVTSAGVVVTVSNTDSTPPVVTVTAPAGGATVFGTVTVSANASDNMTVSGVQFFVDGAPFGAEDTAAPYSAAWDTMTASNGSHALTARARDAAGNTTTSAIVTVNVANGAGTNLRIEEGNTAISYFGAWNVGNTSRPWSGGTASVGFGTGQHATVTFRGTGITWIGFQAPWTGIANVYVDGTLAATVDGYAPTETVQAPLFTVAGLPLGVHTLTIEVTRTKHASSSDFIVIVDAFDITGAPPDSSAPAVAITAPANGATVFGSVTIKADADDDSGVAAVTFFLDGVQLGTADSISPYAFNWNTTTATDGPHTLTAVARDAAGNSTTSTAVAVTVANAAPPAFATATRIENTSLDIVYVDGCADCGQAASWFHGSRSRTWSDGTSSFNRADRGRATYTFTGTAVKWIGFRAGWAGIARVFIDGVQVGEIDLFSPTEEVQVPVFQVTDLAPGVHTIAVEATGRKNAEATDYAVVVDAFDVSPAMPPPVRGTRYEENAPSATFTAGWNMTDTSQAWSGATAAVSSGVAERATFVFTGTSANWIGKRGPGMGIARVYLDGAFQAQVDSYYPSLIQGLVYSVTGLMPGEHRLEIEVTGLKNDQSTGTAVAVDAFDVRTRIEQNDAPVAYTGTWRFDDTNRNWSDTSLTTGVGTASVADAAGARADLTFTGTGVTWLGLRGPWVGIADVSVDGVFAQRIDLYSATEQVQAPIFSVSGLAPGPHTLRVEATGTKNAASATARVVVDTFDVTLSTPAPRVTRVPDTDAAVAYSAGWGSAGASSLWSGGNARETRTVGAQATFSFSGTSVRWIGERGFNTGLARVSIDGQFVALVDTRTPFQEEYQEPVFRATGLAPGTHTLTIEIVGRNNEAPGSIAERVVIDAFDIHQQ